MNFSKFAHSLSKIEQTSKRLEMTKLIAELFNSVDKQEIAPMCYLMQGQLVPSYESKEFQLSTKMLLRVLARLNDGEAEADPQALELQYKQLGDIGLLAEDITKDQAPKNEISILQIFHFLTEIAEVEGKGSQEQKVLLTAQLLQQVDSLSARYITRVMVGKLRLGFSDMTMIDALSWAISGDKSYSKQIELAYQKRADIGYIARVCLTNGIEALAEVQIQVGTPVIPALCQRLNTTQEIIDKMGEVIAEPKYDGTRVQIHISKNSSLIKTFTRNLEESSHMFPELVKFPEQLDCQSCILDAEAIGFDPKTGQLLPFQQTITRKRKHGVAYQADAIPLKFFIFDILEKDGQELIEAPLLKRKQVLERLFADSRHFVHAPYETFIQATPLSLFHEKQLAEGLEGAVIKKVDSGYQSGRKAYSWVKIKESEGNRGKLSDTIDAIVMGYFYGTGKRTELGVGALLIGVMNQDQQIVSISKVGSGLSEELSREFVTRAKSLITAEMPKNYLISKNLIPDIWLTPEMVVEVAADEITQSSLHTAELALRFPRFIRFRDDKKWSDATSLAEIKNMVV